MFKLLGYVAIFSLLFIDTVIVGYVIKVYFIEEETIIAGCIAFVGAVLGGVITLSGVRKTIEANVEIEFKNRIPHKVQTLDKILKELNGILKELLVNDEKIVRYKPIAANIKIDNVFLENELINKALAVSPEAYWNVKELSKVLNTNWLFYSQSYDNDDEDYEELDNKRKLEFYHNCSSSVLKCILGLEEEQTTLLDRYH